MRAQLDRDPKIHNGWPTRESQHVFSRDCIVLTYLSFECLTPKSYSSLLRTSNAAWCVYAYTPRRTLADLVAGVWYGCSQKPLHRPRLRPRPLDDRRVSLLSLGRQEGRKPFEDVCLRQDFVEGEDTGQLGQGGLGGDNKQIKRHGRQKYSGKGNHSDQGFVNWKFSFLIFIFISLWKLLLVSRATINSTWCLFCSSPPLIHHVSLPPSRTDSMVCIFTKRRPKISSFPFLASPLCSGDWKVTQAACTARHKWDFPSKFINRIFNQWSKVFWHLGSKKRIFILLPGLAFQISFLRKT
jgi:hypothetical protein